MQLANSSSQANCTVFASSRPTIGRLVSFRWNPAEELTASTRERSFRISSSLKLPDCS